MKFVDTIERGSQDAIKAPEAFYLWSERKSLDELIDGFVTLRVKGINQLQQEPNIVDFVGDGGRLLSNRLPSREIEITFLLKASSPAELVEKQTAINHYLYSSKTYRFTFATMPLYFYEGVTTSIEYEEGKRWPIGTISITCPSPYRFKNALTELANGSPLSSDLGIGSTYYPETLEFTTDSTSAITVKSSNGKQVKLLANTSSGSKVYKLNFNSGALSVNGVSYNQLIDITSNISDFTVDKGGSFSVNGITSAVLKFRAKEVG